MTLVWLQKLGACSFVICCGVRSFYKTDAYTRNNAIFHSERWRSQQTLNVVKITDEAECCTLALLCHPLHHNSLQIYSEFILKVSILIKCGFVLWYFNCRVLQYFSSITIEFNIISHFIVFNPSFTAHMIFTSHILMHKSSECSQML